MAGSSHPKPPSHKPLSSSSSHRKSRWESDGNAPIDKKPGDSKGNKPLSNPSPKTGPSPGKPQTPVEVAAHSGAGSIQHLMPPQFLFPDPASMGPPPPPAYGFHMLERRTIVLADGSVRSYFALPQDYQDFVPQRRPMDHAGMLGGLGPSGPGFGLDGQFPHGGVMRSLDGFQDKREDLFGRSRGNEYWNSLGLDGRGGTVEGPIKRKYGEEEKERMDEKGEFGRQRHQVLHPNGYSLGPGDGSQHFLGTTSSPFGREGELRASKIIKMDGGYEGAGMQYGNSGGRGGNRVGLLHVEVDQKELKKAFLHFVKLINENASQRKLYLDNGKQGPLKCIACRRTTKDFQDMHGLIMHTYNTDDTDVRVDHLGLHKALCVLMGWNYSKPPDNSKGYQFLSADEAISNQDDLIMWPPVVIIHNTLTGKSKDGRMEGLGNKAMDNKIRELGFGGGKSKSLYGREGHQGITLIKFSGDEPGLKEAMQLAAYFERENRGRKGWARVQPLTVGKDKENHPSLVKVDERSGEKNRILYGYLGTATDLDKIDFDTRKKVVIESGREYKES